ncbi:helix-turn-helix domain-containing protein [Streptomonospora algeriensis]|uniref:Helix-turn-helix domain-containing protein n=1 Tax=Streptomonospora algeriensis TaxID=995084 RepID=A0ABW3BFY2_9ACTN
MTQTATTATPEKSLYYLDEAMHKLSLGRSQLYEEMKAGRLRFVKVGRARRIPAAAIEDFVALLEGQSNDDRAEVL